MVATQLRAVPHYCELAAISSVTATLDNLRNEMHKALPDADHITFHFGQENISPGLLKVVIKTNTREGREAIIHALRAGPIDDARFVKIIEGVETGARRRLTITAEVR
jgi:hypothetical protein